MSSLWILEAFYFSNTKIMPKQTIWHVHLTATQTRSL